MAPGEAGYRFGAKLGLDVCIVRAALLGAELPQGTIEAINIGAKAEFPVSPADLAPLQGKELGICLRELEARWIASEFKASKRSLLA